MNGGRLKTCSETRHTGFQTTFLIISGSLYFYRKRLMKKIL
ncbi:hypothetical protein HMPREF9418_2197 [Neisseria macacae ATCC 33926]|uniref:Uncharacterized protein n=1 Tax=Neisseria macacae ATCC 33926 TaxID=997348 RepID=A0AA36UHT7_9NEIS|nr:hypothetical protein HMPREF9418_2197 [Neisseria macacae ATCC 33926]